MLRLIEKGRILEVARPRSRPSQLVVVPPAITAAILTLTLRGCFSSFEASFYEGSGADHCYLTFLPSLANLILFSYLNEIDFAMLTSSLVS